MNKDTLKKEWEEFEELPFPDTPKDHRLNELFADLVLIDGETAGIISSFLHGTKVDKTWIYIDDEFNKKLNTFKPMDPATERIWNTMRSYKDKLDRMVNILLAIYDNT